MSVSARVLRVLSPAGSQARLSVFIFHRVLAEADPLFPDLPDAARFAQMLRWLKAWFNVLRLDEAVRLLTSGRLPERAAAVTFDDGYADNASVALPLLRAAGLPATFFIATGFLDGGRMWNDTVIEAIRGWPSTSLDATALGLGRHALASDPDRRQAIDACIAQMKYRPAGERLAQADTLAHMARIVPSRDLMMTSADVRTLREAGMQIGAHTVSHPILRRVSLAEARSEIELSRSRLETLIGERVGLFAYPNGKRGEDYDDEHVRLVRELGFDAAVSTEPGAADAHSDPMQLPRFTPWDRGRMRFCARLARNLWHARREDRAGAPIPHH